METKKYFVYAIKSQKDGRIYVGLSSNPHNCLKSYNKGETFSTKGWRPWVLFYTELIGDRKEARIVERKLKSGAGKRVFKINKCKKELRHLSSAAEQLFCKQ